MSHPQISVFTFGSIAVGAGKYHSELSQMFHNIRVRNKPTCYFQKQ